MTAEFDPDVYFMADFELADLRRNGYAPVGLDGFYKCLWGCGLVVWDMEAHREVCKNFDERIALIL